VLAPWKKLVDKLIRKFTKNGVVEALLRAGRSWSRAQMCETATRSRDCGKWADGALLLASKLSRIPSRNARALSDSEVLGKARKLGKLYDRARRHPCIRGR
jgi:hypothetical protein